jgi:TetR/AcrR family transcriptional regulator, regulator of cefoperazone and chloramphenicol sensitivity
LLLQAENHRSDKPISGAEVTRVSLLEAAIRLFGEHGYDAVSTRDIADFAAANIGSIAYHFGGKPGLRLACADHVIELVRNEIGMNFKRQPPPMTPDVAEMTLVNTMNTFIRFWVANPGMRHAVVFMAREMLNPGEVSDLIYKNWMRPMHERLCAMFSAITGMDADSERLKVIVFSMTGSAFHYRIAMPFVQRRLEWDVMGDKEVDRLCDHLVQEVRDLIDAHKPRRHLS